MDLYFYQTRFRVAAALPQLKYKWKMYLLESVTTHSLRLMGLGSDRQSQRQQELPSVL